MAKNITVTSMDGINISDKSNISSGQPRKRVKMLHEQIFDQYGIDPKKIYEKTGLLKTLHPDWIPTIIAENIKSCKIPRIHQNINLQDRTITVGFESSEACEAFYKEFNTNMNKAINTFLIGQNEDPKRYNRIVITETTVDNQQITIRY